MKVPRKKTAIGFLLLSFSLSTCDQGGDAEIINTDQPGKYVISLLLPGWESEAIHPISDLTTGQAEIKDAFQLPNGSDVAWNGHGFVVTVQQRPGKCTKYTVAEKVAVSQELRFLGDFRPTTILKLDESRVWYVTDTYRNTVYWETMNLSPMTVLNSGSFTLPIEEGHELSGIGFARSSLGGHIIGYEEHSITDVTDNSVRIAVLDGATYALKYIDTDDRSCCPGNLFSQAAFQTENGDVYFAVLPYSFSYQPPEKPSGFMRVTKGDTQIDKLYFLNATEKLNGNNLTGSMIYLGDNKLLAQVVREELAVNGDRWGLSSGVYLHEWYLFDISTQAASKLDIPLSRGVPSNNAIKTSDGLVAIIANTEEGNYIYTYNPRNGEIKRGLSYLGAEVINSIYNID